MHQFAPIADRLNSGGGYPDCVSVVTMRTICLAFEKSLDSVKKGIVGRYAHPVPPGSRALNTLSFLRCYGSSGFVARSQGCHAAVQCVSSEGTCSIPRPRFYLTSTLAGIVAQSWLAGNAGGLRRGKSVTRTKVQDTIDMSGLPLLRTAPYGTVPGSTNEWP